MASSYLESLEQDVYRELWNKIQHYYSPNPNNTLTLECLKIVKDIKFGLDKNIALLHIKSESGFIRYCAKKRLMGDVRT